MVHMAMLSLWNRIGSTPNRIRATSRVPPGGARNDRYALIRDHTRRGLVPSRLVNPGASSLCSDRFESTIIYRLGAPGGSA
jgi:hypothetical protein